MNKNFKLFNLKNKGLILLIVLSLLALSFVDELVACSCNWNGPFLKVYSQCPLVVLGKIMRHNPGVRPIMDVYVLEVLIGSLLDSGIRIEMGDGMHCRPTLKQFPEGSVWILALNGPGSKPGDGLAISSCGAFYLQLSQDLVIGNISKGRDDIQTISYYLFKNIILYPKFREKFTARIRNGEKYQHFFGNKFLFILEPFEDGWEIVIKENGREDENLARLTPPFHFSPNPRYIEGWHFLKELPEGCAPAGGDLGLASPDFREFIFSPEVGKSIAGPDAQVAVSAEDVEKVSMFGRGWLKVKSLKLEERAGQCPLIAELEFEVELTGGYALPDQN